MARLWRKRRSDRVEGTRIIPSAPVGTLSLLGWDDSMRSIRALAAVTGALALASACGGGDNVGPNDPPVANFTAPACTVNTPCNFTDASTDDNGVSSWRWNFDDGTPVSEAQNPVHTFTVAGTYDVTLTVTDGAGETNAKTVPVTVTAAASTAPRAEFGVTCISLECTFDDRSTDNGTITSWIWSFGDGNTTNVQDPTHTYQVNALTTFTVSLTVTDDTGEQGTVTHEITVAPPATLTCGTTPDCSLDLLQAATVTVTLASADCELEGNTFKFTEPVEETIFTDGCNEAPLPKTYPVNGGAAFAAGTQLRAQVISGGATLELPPAVRVNGTYPEWTLEFDDGAQSEPPEPDFNDLVIRITATATPP
jgi:PKD repeat protein